MFLKVSYKNYVVYFYVILFLSVKDLDFKYLFLNLDRFIIALRKFFVIKGASFAGIYSYLTGAYLLKTERIVSLKPFLSFLSNLQVFMPA